MTHRVTSVVHAIVILAGACTKPGASARPVPPTPPVVQVILDEYEFRYPEPVPGGRVVFRIANRGTLEHELTLVPLDAGVPPIAEQLRSAERRVVRPIARVPPRRPGQDGSFAVDLVAEERYAFVCYVRNADGQAHALLGMGSEFRTGPAWES